VSYSRGSHRRLVNHHLPVVRVGGILSNQCLLPAGSTQKVVIDNCPCFRERLLLCRSQDVTRPCSQKSTRAWIYLYPPTRSVPDGGQGVSSILNMICARFGHGIILTNVARTRNLVCDGRWFVNLRRVILAASHWLSVHLPRRGTLYPCLGGPARSNNGRWFDILSICDQRKLQSSCARNPCR